MVPRGGFCQFYYLVLPLVLPLGAPCCFPTCAPSCAPTWYCLLAKLGPYRAVVPRVAFPSAPAFCSSLCSRLVLLVLPIAFPLLLPPCAPACIPALPPLCSAPALCLGSNRGVAHRVEPEAIPPGNVIGLALVSRTGKSCHNLLDLKTKSHRLVAAAGRALDVEFWFWDILDCAVLANAMMTLPAGGMHLHVSRKERGDGLGVCFDMFIDVGCHWLEIGPQLSPFIYVVQPRAPCPSQDVWSMHADLLPDFLAARIFGHHDQTAVQIIEGWAARYGVARDAIVSDIVFSMPLAMTVSVTLDRWPFVVAASRVSRRWDPKFPLLQRPAVAELQPGAGLDEGLDMMEQPGKGVPHRSSRPQRDLLVQVVCCFDCS
jgi:hypothetical protein